MPRFSSENQPKERRKRGQDKRTMILTGLKKAGMTEEQYWEKVAETALVEPSIMRMVSDKLLPSVKPTAPHIEFDFPHDGTASDKAGAIEKAAADGVLPIDLALSMITIIRERLTIHTDTELSQRMEAAIERLEKQSNA